MTPTDLQQCDALTHLGASGTADTWRFTKGRTEVEVKVRGPMRTNAVYALRDGAIAGLGVALLPDWLVAADVAAGRLKVLLPGFASMPTVISAVYRTEHRGMSRVKAFVEHLARQYER